MPLGDAPVPVPAAPAGAGRSHAGRKDKGDKKTRPVRPLWGRPEEQEQLSPKVYTSGPNPAMTQSIGGLGAIGPWKAGRRPFGSTGNYVGSP